MALALSLLTFRLFVADEYYYSLRDVIFCLENIEDTVADYRRKAVTAKVTAVVEQDRQALRNYLTGVTDSCPQIDSVALNSYSQGSIARVTESATTETNSTLSTERMIEQREKHAALLEKSVQKNKTTLLVDQSPRYQQFSASLQFSINAQNIC